MNISLPTDVATLQSMLVAAYTDSSYGCLTRPGLEALHRYSEGKEVLFLDLDGMHDLNAQFGYAEVDARIAASLASVRHSDVVCARWYSGDEIIFIVNTGDAAGLAARLQSAFVNAELSATYGFAPLSADLTASVNKASGYVQFAKSVGRRGTISGFSHGTEWE